MRAGKPDSRCGLQVSLTAREARGPFCLKGGKMPSSRDFKSKYGPWALVTGAAWGLGTEYARQIGALGLNLVLVDIRADDLRRVAEEVRSKGGVEVKAVVTDLSRPDFIEGVRG